jgi:hypothetical protein
MDLCGDLAVGYLGSLENAHYDAPFQYLIGVPKPQQYNFRILPGAQLS